MTETDHSLPNHLCVNSWRNTQSIDRWCRHNEFIEKYPDAINVIDARIQLNQLAFDLAKESKDVHKLDQFIKDYPEAKQVPEAQNFRNQWSYITLLEREQELDKIALEKQNIEIKKIEAEINTQKAQNTTLTISLILTAVILSLAFYGFILTIRPNTKISKQKNEIKERNTHIAAHTVLNSQGRHRGSSKCNAMDSPMDLAFLVSTMGAEQKERKEKRSEEERRSVWSAPVWARAARLRAKLCWHGRTPRAALAVRSRIFQKIPAGMFRPEFPFFTGIFLFFIL